jgi:hypothetical protein
MTKTSKEEGIVQALVDRFVNLRLPAVLDLKEKVDAGETLNDIDIDYLEQVIRDAEANKALVDRHPEWHKISTQVISLYKEITARALENEKNS